MVHPTRQHASKAPTLSEKELLLQQLGEPELNGFAPFHVVASERHLPPGGPDAVGLDQAGRLVLIYAGARDEDPWSLALLDGLAWIDQHRKVLGTRLSPEGWIEDLPPRLVLLAPEFPKRLRARLEALASLDVCLLESGWVEMEGERRLAVRPVYLARQVKAEGEDWALRPGSALCLQQALEKIPKMDPGIRIDAGANRFDILYRGALLAVIAARQGRLRVVVPGGTIQDLEVEDPDALKPVLDQIYRRFVEAGLAEIETLSQARSAGKEVAPRGAEKPAGIRPVLTAEEIEAIAEP